MVKMLTVLVSKFTGIFDIFFSTKILAYKPYLMIKVLTIR